MPDEGWTLVDRSHGKARGISDRLRNHSDNSDGLLDNERLRYDELDNFMDTKMLPDYRKEVVRITDMATEITSDTRTVIVDVEPIGNEHTDRLDVIPINKTEGRDEGLVNMVFAPSERISEYSEIRTQPVELLPESCVVVTNEMAEEIMTGLWPDGSDERTGMSAVETSVIDEDIIEPVTRRLSAEVVEEYEAVDITCEEYTDEHLLKNETTNLSVSTELMDLPIMMMTRGFFNLAEEARLVDVKLTPSGCMNDIIQQITEREEPMSKDISWKIDEVMEQSVDATCEVARTVPTAKFDIGRLMQWPDVKSTGMMICEFTLESEMFCASPVWREAEPVFVAAESEVFTPVFTGGGGGGL